MRLIVFWKLFSTKIESNMNHMSFSIFIWENFEFELIRLDNIIIMVMWYGIMISYHNMKSRDEIEILFGYMICTFCMVYFFINIRIS